MYLCVTVSRLRRSASASARRAAGRTSSRTANISADGRLVEFISTAKNLAPASRHPLPSYMCMTAMPTPTVSIDETCDGCRSTDRLPLDPPDLPDDGSVSDLAMSGDGNTVAYVRTLTNPATTSPEAPSAWDATVWIYDRPKGRRGASPPTCPVCALKATVSVLCPSPARLQTTVKAEPFTRWAFVTYGGQFWAAYSASPRQFSWRTCGRDDGFDGGSMIRPAKLVVLPNFARQFPAA